MAVRVKKRIKKQGEKAQREKSFVPSNRPPSRVNWTNLRDRLELALDKNERLARFEHALAAEVIQILEKRRGFGTQR